MRRQHRFLSVLTALLLAAVTALTVGPAPSASAAGYPASIAALGDSISRGFNAGGWFSDWPSRSWSTGNDTAVVSHHRRLSRLNKTTTVRAYNDARTGAKMGELVTQAGSAVSQDAGYVTVLMGANDACTSTEAAMTPVPTFRSQFTSAMSVLMNQATPPRVLVAGIPNIYRLWNIGKDSSAARSAWNSFDICQSMLARPRSTDQADVDRRKRVRQRVVDYNRVLAEVCATHATCRYDGGAVFDYPFKLRHLSGWDYFHPNTSGQAALAEVTWKAGFWPNK